MASPDFYEYAAQQRLQQIEAQEAQARADLAAHKAGNDYQSAAGSVQQIANLAAEKANLYSLHRQYVESQTPPAPVELTAEERHAKPADRMDYGDVWEISQRSKHGVDENAFRAGMAEVARRRARGE